MASGVWSQQSSTPLQACWDVQDKEGMRLEDALKEIGYLGDTPCDYRENGLECHFELHIEQGPILEKETKSIGVVTSVQAMKWFSIRVEGVEGHSGTTPMSDRSDALVTASRLIAAVRDCANDTGLGVATVGVIIIDMRCSTDARLERLVRHTFGVFDSMVKLEMNATSYRIERSWGLPESKFHLNCIEAVRAAAIREVGEGQVMEMKSHAGHDSAWTSRVCPTSMIFVPSKDGVSHNPHEYTSPEHCALGAQTLLDAVLYYDGKAKSGVF
jgi:hydantoinase/carbamoylase family amidase